MLKNKRKQWIAEFGEPAYFQEVRVWRPLFHQIMTRHKCDEMAALRRLLINASQHRDRVKLTKVMSAVGCELVMPSDPAVSYS